MVSNHKVKILPLPFLRSQFSQRCFHLKKCMSGSCAQSHNQFWFDDVKLPFQKRHARLNLILVRRPVVWRSTLENVADVHLIPGPFYSCENFIQQLPRPAYKRFTLNIFVPAWCLANKDQVSMRITHAKNKLDSGATKRTLYALADLLSETVQGEGAILIDKSGTLSR